MNQTQQNHAKKHAIPFFSLITLFLSFSTHLIGSTPHSDFQSAVSQAKKGEYIAVYLHGSDWNKLGEWVKEKIWDKPSFQEALENTHSLSIDHPEHQEYKLNQNLNKLLNKKYSPLALQQATSNNDSTEFNKQKDGAYLVTGKAGNKESYALDIHFKNSAEIIFFDILSNPNHPQQKQGRSSNGNFAISEVEAETAAGEKIQLVAAYASHDDGKRKAYMTIDGKNSKNSSWNSDAHKNKEVKRFALVPETPFKGGVRIILHFHVWSQHSFAHFKLYSSNDSELKQSLIQLHQTAHKNELNSKLSPNLLRYPALILANHKGEKVALIDDFSIRSKPEQVLKAIKEKKKLAQQRENYWQQAQSTTGKAKIEAISKGLEVEGLLLEKKSRQALIKELRKLGTQYDDPNLRKHLFDIKPIQKEVDKLAKQNKHKAALQLVKKEATLPVNSRLSTDRIQEIYMIAFYMCQEWKGNEDKRYSVLKRILKIDPNSHLGMGALGYLMKDGKGPVSINWGWRPKDIKKGKQTLIIKQGVNNAFYSQGKFRLTLELAKGKDPVYVEELSLLSDGEAIATTEKRTRLQDDSVFLTFNLNPQQVKSTLTLRVKLNTPVGTDHQGKFIVDRLL